MRVRGGWVAVVLAAWTTVLADAPARLHPGDTLTFPLATGLDSVVVLEVGSDVDQPLTIEARSLELDVKIAVTSPTPFADDNGLGGTDAAVEFPALAAQTYRVELRAADPTEEARGVVTITVRAGTKLVLEDTVRTAADDAYWSAVRAAGDERADPWLRVRGRLGTGKVHFEKGDYAAMEADFAEAAAIAKATWGDSNGRAATALADVGLARYLTGNLTGAREAINAAMPVLESRYPPDDDRIATCLNYRGLVEESLGELRLARDAYERALSIRERRDGPTSPSVVAPLGNLASLTDELGDPETALGLYRRALAIVEQDSAAQSRLAVMLNNVAFELKRTGRRQEAVAYYERALSIRKAKLGDDHPSVAVTMQNLGVCWLELGDTDKAIALLQQALAIREKRLGPDHPDVAVTLGNLARAYHESGRDAEALPLIERALAIRTEKLGPAHPDTAKQRLYRARVLAALGQTNEAVSDALAAEAIGREDARRVARFLPESRALQYAGERAQGLDVAISALCASPGSAANVKRAWDAAVKSRSLVLDEMARRARSVRSREDSATRAAREALERAVGAWTKLVAGGSGLKGAALRTALDDAGRELGTAERKLADLSASYRSEARSRETGWTDVARVLPAGAWLVSFEKFQRDGRTHGDAYAAFLLPPGGEPRLVDLGAAKAIDDAIEAWRKAVAATGGADVAGESAKEAAAREAGLALRRAIWDPLRIEAQDSARVVVVPDGAIHLVPFAALPGSGPAYLLETGPAFAYASAERDLVEPVAAAARGSMLALGGPSFDGPSALPASLVRGNTVTPCGTGPVLHFAPLPHAAREAGDVAKLVGGQSKVLVGADATESAFKKLAPGNAVVHLATHGFALGDRCSAFGQSPLRLTGLALAGANRPAAGPRGDDGVLTAEEVAALDLSTASWVALSSCESGGGTVAQGEGVLGLRRAFTIAGARTLLLTLWPVDDRDARRYMTAVYRLRFEGGEAPSAAARKASVELLRERRSRGLDTSPAHWGAFVVTGL